MKRAILATTALVSASLSPILSTAASAQDLDLTPTAATAALIAGQCTTYLGTLSGGDYFISGYDVDSQDSAWGSEVSRVIDETTRAAAPGATPTYSDIDASGASHLVRNGKSPNIFATDALANTTTWSNSTYSYDGLFNITTTFNFTCHVSEHIAAVDAVYEKESDCEHRVFALPDDDPIKTDPTYRSAGNWCSYSPNPGSGIYPHRLELSPAVEKHDEARSELDGQSSQTETGTHHDTRFEANGGVWVDTSNSHQVATVVCISPGSKGGLWTAKNMYAGLGGTCSTATFNGIPPGTIIPSASLPLI